MSIIRIVYIVHGELFFKNKINIKTSVHTKTPDIEFKEQF